MTARAAAAYQEVRERMSSTLRSAGAAAEQVGVPACPGWTPKDVASHLTGVCADVLAGRLDGVGTDPWTAVQVEDRRAKSLDDVLAEWADVGAQIEAMLPNFPEWAANQTVFDLLTHEHDIADALGLAPPDGAQAEGPALEFAANALTARVEQLGLPPLIVASGGKEWKSAGDGEAARLAAEPVDVMRSVTGRRTAEEIQALDWGGSDATPWLPAFEIGHFKLRDTPIGS